MHKVNLATVSLKPSRDTYEKSKHTERVKLQTTSPCKGVQKNKKYNCLIRYFVVKQLTLEGFRRTVTLQIEVNLTIYKDSSQLKGVSIVRIK